MPVQAEPILSLIPGVFLSLCMNAALFLGSGADSAAVKAEQPKQWTQCEAMVFACKAMHEALQLSAPDKEGEIELLMGSNALWS